MKSDRGSYCWEFMKCGKEMQNWNTQNPNTCPAGTSLYGKVCYAVANTLCDQCDGGNFTEKYKDCKNCDFFQKHAFKEKIVNKNMCWEVINCGREIGGKLGEKGDVCPAANPLEGRACWVVSGTLCNGKVQGSFAQKIIDCRKCHFFKTILEEHRTNYR